MDKVKGLITDVDYTEMAKDFQLNREHFEQLIKDTSGQIDVLEGRIAAGDNRRALIEQYINLEHLNRDVVETLIDHIEVGKRIPGTKDVPIEIHWNF